MVVQTDSIKMPSLMTLLHHQRFFERKKSDRQNNHYSLHSSKGVHGQSNQRDFQSTIRLIGCQQHLPNSLHFFKKNREKPSPTSLQPHYEVMFIISVIFILLSKDHHRRR
jgi:hypothetical protein